MYFVFREQVIYKHSSHSQSLNSFCREYAMHDPGVVTFSDSAAAEVFPREVENTKYQTPVRPWDSTSVRGGMEREATLDGHHMYEMHPKLSQRGED